MRRVLRSSIRWTTGFLILFSTTLCFGNESNVVAQATSEDIATQQAIQFSLLGEPAALDNLARSREAEEKALKKSGTKPIVLSDNIALLSGAIQPRVRSEKVTKGLLDHFQQDSESEQLFALVKQVNQRERFARARNNQRYEAARRQVNSFTGAIFSVLQLQLFGLVQPPLDFAEWYTVGRKTLTPEQRREFAEARKYISTEPPAEEKLKPKAEAIIRKYPDKRLRTVLLQAERNAEREYKQGDLYNALWWFDRELLLQNETQPKRKNHLKLAKQLQDETEGRENSLSILEDREAILEGNDFALYSELLEAALLQTSYAELEASILSSFPEVGTETSKLTQDYVLLQAASLEREGNPIKGRELLNWAAEQESGFWVDRSALYLQREDFNPALAFAEAKANYSRQVRRYLFLAESPRFNNKHLSADDTRELETGWTRSIRSLFVIDVISRAIILPLLPGSTFSREDFLDVYGRLTPQDLSSPEGREWKIQTLRAFRKMKRWKSASELAAELGETKKAEKYSVRSVTQKIGRIETYTPEVRLQQFQALVESTETEKGKAVAQEALKNEEARQDVLAVLERKFVKQNPTDWRKSLLNIPVEWSDGKKSNGEIGSEGLYLLETDQVRFKNKADGEWLTFDVTPGSVLSSVRLIYPRRRADEIEEFMNQPQEKKRIPIQVEGSAFPGVNVLPGLVPLDPNQRTRRLYQ